jgi:hypothetical protein
MTSSSQRAARAAGLVTGLALAALLVFAMRVPASDQSLGASVRVEVLPPGELDAGDDSVLISAPNLVAGEERRGAVTLRNITAGDVRVHVRKRAHGLAGAVRLELRAGGQRLRRGFVLDKADTIKLRARAFVPAGAEGYEGREARVALVLRTKLLEARP